MNALVLATSTSPFASISFADITGYATEIAGQVVAPLITVIGLVVGMRLLKKFGHQIG